MEIASQQTAAGGDDGSGLRLRLPYRPGGEQSGTGCLLPLRCRQRSECARIDAKLAAGARRAFAVASCAALLYRYTGQATVALQVRRSTANDSRAAVDVAPAVRGDLRFTNLLRDCENRLDQAPATTAANPQVLVTLACGDDDDQAPAGAELEFRMFAADGRLRPELRYDPGLLSAGTAQRMLRHLVLLMADAVRAPDTEIRALTMMTPGDHRWLAAHGDGGRGKSRNGSVLEEIEAHAARRGDSVAVRMGDASLSYRELDARANALAKYLVSHGAQRGDRIAVCLAPCLDVAVALLAVFKAGGTWLPLNPEHPRRRLQAIVADAQPAVLLTHDAHRELLADTGLPVVCLDTDRERFADSPATRPGELPAADDPATIYYTSGTTGRPKGVIASHSNLRHVIDVTRSSYGIAATDVIPAVAAFTFSISIFELLAPLAAGGTLVLLPREEVLDAARMTETLQQVSFAHIGPALLRRIVRHVREQGLCPSAFARLRHLSTGGDMIPPQLLRDLQRRFPRAELYVIYGCSEISLMGCTQRVYPQDEIERTYVGRPFPNVGLRLLDDDDNPVPPGAVGDVCFAGNGITAGYVERPALTAEKYFRADGRLWYRTGDRGRFDPGGRLELLGRRDFQVQLRGMRIELGEIEFHLRRAPGVREGVVTQVEIDDERHALVAWFVAEPGAAPTERELAAHMRRDLPDYMVPGYFRPLDALPLNHNLKVDRAALPPFRLPESRDVVAPRTVTEKQLAAIWRRVLNLPDVGVDDNFMLLGGDSLLAMEMILTVQRELRANLDGMDVLRESLQVLAAICDDQRPAHDAAAPHPRVARQASVIESFHFGDDQSLYGLYHPPREAAAGAVLICPALGHEHARSHFLLKTLATRLAAAGHAVLRFDYYGTADSLGDSIDGGPERWRADIAVAAHELRARSGVERPAVLGVRLGANLAAQALAPDEVDALLAWDPVVDGRAHLDRLQAMHRRRLRRLNYLRRFRRTANPGHGRELLGLTFSASGLADLERRRLAADLAPWRSGHVVRSRGLPCELPDSLPSTAVDIDCGWYDVRRLGTAIGTRDLLPALERQLREALA